MYISAASSVPTESSKRLLARPAHRNALTALALAMSPMLAMAQACGDTNTSASPATNGAFATGGAACPAAFTSYSGAPSANGALLYAAGASAAQPSQLTVSNAAGLTLQPSAGVSGVAAGAYGQITVPGLLDVATTGIGSSLIGPVVAVGAGSVIHLTDVTASTTGGDSTSTIGARFGGIVNISGVTHASYDGGKLATVVDAQVGAAEVHLGTQTTLMLKTNGNNLAGGAALGSEGTGSTVSAKGPITIRTDAMMGIYASESNFVAVQQVDIQTGVQITGNPGDPATVSGYTNAYGQGVIANTGTSSSNAATITFMGGTVASYVRSGIEARSFGSITSTGATTVASYADNASGVFANGMQSQYINTGALTVLTKATNNDGITVNTGKVSVTGALAVDVSGAPSTANTACNTGAGVCLIGDGSVFSADASGAAGDGHIASTGYALQMSSGAGQSVTIGGTAMSTSGGSELITIQGATGTSALRLSNSSATAGSSQVLLSVNGNSQLAFGTAQTQLTGNVNVGAGSTVNLSLASSSVLSGVVTAADTSLDASSIWNVAASSTPASLGNAGAVNYPAPTGGAFSTVTTSTYYVSQGGALAMHTQLGTDGSPSDQLIVTTDVLDAAPSQVLPLAARAKAASSAQAAAPTKITITNVGGAGAATTGNGILVVKVNGQSPASAFVLANQPLTAGAFTYQLVQQADGNWYLTSELTPLVPPTLTGGAPNGTVGTVYTGFTPVIGPANATQPITLSVVTGSLPPGLSIDPATGRISGTPTKVGIYPLTLRATNSAGTADLQISIGITDSGLPPDVRDGPGNGSIAAVPSLSSWGVMMLSMVLAALGGSAPWRKRRRAKAETRI